MMYEINHHMRHHTKRQSLSFLGLTDMNSNPELTQVSDKAFNLPKIDAGTTSFLDSVSSQNEKQMKEDSSVAGATTGPAMFP